MPNAKKILHGDLKLITEKVACGVTSFGTQISHRDTWISEADGKKCALQVFEKMALEPGKAHYSLSVAYFDTGEEIRVYATTSGGSNLYWGNPYPDGEGELTRVLGTVLDVLDDIII